MAAAMSTDGVRCVHCSHRSMRLQLMRLSYGAHICYVDAKEDNKAEELWTVELH